MTKAELTQARQTAEGLDSYIEAAFAAADAIDQAERDSSKAYLPIEAVAALVRYQAHRFDGTWDLEELNLLANWLRWRVVVI